MGTLAVQTRQEIERSNSWLKKETKITDFQQPDKVEEQAYLATFLRLRAGGIRQALRR